MMKAKHLRGTGSNVSKNSKVAINGNLSRWVFNSGDIAWVRVKGCSWWPAQVIDEKSVSARERPKKKLKGEVLVRLYGSYHYLSVENIKCSTEFENILKQNNSSIRETLQKALAEDLSHIKSGGKSKKEISVSKETKDTRPPKQDRIKRNWKADCLASAGTSLEKTDETAMDQSKGTKKTRGNDSKDKKPKQVLVRIHRVMRKARNMASKDKKLMHDEVKESGVKQKAKGVASKQHGLKKQKLAKKAGDEKHHGTKNQKLTENDGDEKQHGAKRQKSTEKAGDEKQHGAKRLKATEKDGDQNPEQVMVGIQRVRRKARNITSKDMKLKPDWVKESKVKQKARDVVSEQYGAKKHKLTEKARDEKQHGAKNQKLTENARDEKQHGAKRQKLTGKAGDEKHAAKRMKLTKKDEDEKQHGAKKRLMEKAGDEKKYGARKQMLTEKAGDVKQNGAKERRVLQKVGDEKHGAKRQKITEKIGNELSKLKGQNQDGVRKLKQQDVTKHEKADSNGTITQAKQAAPDKTPDVSARRMKVMQSLGLIAPLGSPFLKNGFLKATPCQC